MALYAFDGTWSSDDKPQDDTNVVHFRDAYDSGQVVYFSGPGTRLGLLGRIAGGLTGAGGHNRVRAALKILQANIAKGDSIIDIVGFSRGAALALDFANLLPACVRVRFLGLFDTVPSFGLPGNSIDIGWKLDLPVWVDHCFHAMAMDETRYNFPLRRLVPNPRLTQIWFRGMHSDVGGGNHNNGLSSIPLNWMFGAAHNCGIQLKTWKVMENRALMNPAAPITQLALNTRLRPRIVQPGDTVHPSVLLAEAASLAKAKRSDEPKQAA